ncbi:MAG: hypothetical protein R3C02_24800 [Planctomycetaceae bacterium]
MSDLTDIEAKQKELADLKQRVRQLESELSEQPSGEWPPPGFYGDYYAYSGAVLGSVAAMVSLLANVIGAPVAGKSALELIRIYLTFPMGEKALQLSGDDGGLTLMLGCCLYLMTGMILGIPIFWLLIRICGTSAALVKRLVVASILAIGLWLISYYGILSWLQPRLFGGNWITDPSILPPWVAAGTHLLFGWVIAILAPWGMFQPYRRPTSATSA